jgi:alpha-tubulin suppressor-like RCC1 family protein
MLVVALLITSVLTGVIGSPSSAATPISTTALDGGGLTSCAVRTGGAAYCWGDNSFGQIGDGTTASRVAPTLVSGGYTWSTISTFRHTYSSGYATTCGVTTTGTGYCWGGNSNGTVGDGSTTQRTTPTLVSGGYTWQTIQVGWIDVCGLTTSGAIYCWGNNSAGEGGAGNTTQHSSPTLVTGGYTWASLSVGDQSACGVTTSNVGYCWGANWNGQIGNGNTTSQSSPTLISGSHSWSQISTGENGACGVTTTGVGYCWGAGGNGQLGSGGTPGQQTSPIAVSGGYTWSQIAEGSASACGVTTSGTGYCWGYNNNGQLGNNSLTQSTTPSAISGNINFSSITAAANNTSSQDTMCGLSVGGIAYCWGYNANNQIGDRTTTTRQVPVAVVWVNVNTTTNVAPGGRTSCAIRNGGIAYCWGDNSYGQLGNGSTLNSSVPTMVLGNYTWASISSGTDSYDGLATTCGVTTSGAGYCWGSNGNGQGGDGTATNHLVPTLVSGGYTWASITVGFFDACGITTSGAGYCWGANVDGEDGNNTTTQNNSPVAINGGYTWAQLSLGDGSTCGVTTSYVGYCWGTDNTGQLGINSSADAKSVPTLVNGGRSWAQVSTGVYDSCGVTTAGAGFCWGYNNAGEVGNNLTAEVNVPTSVNGSYTWSQIWEGSKNTCGLTTAGVAYCWGINTTYEVGDGSVTTRKIPTLVSGGLTFQSVAVGDDYTDDTNCGLTAGGTESCWGNNNKFQIGDQTNTNRGAPTGVIWPGANTVTSIAPGGETNCSVKAGVGYCWGDNTYGQVGDGTTTNRTSPTQVSGGYQWSMISTANNSAGSLATTCGVTTAGVGYCWGNNSHGQVGDTTTTNRPSPTLVSGSHTWASISVGMFDVCGVTTAGAGYCWGWNFYGEDGTNNTTEYHTPTSINGGYTWSQISVGWGFTCGVTTTNAGYCWGYNTYGELGINSTTQKKIPTSIYNSYSWAQISAGTSDTCGITTTGTGYCWGQNTNGEVGNNSTSEVNIPTAVNGGYTWAQINSSYQTSCGVTIAGIGYCWGYNGNGNLGENNSGVTNSLTPVGIYGGMLFQRVLGGGDNSSSSTECGLTVGGAEYCWGYNDDYQVGDGTTTNWASPKAVVWNDTSPNAPTSLAQFYSDGSTTLPTGTWIGPPTQATTVISATVADADVGDTASLCVELIPTGNSFLNSPTACSVQLPTGSTASIKFSSLVDAGYKWQAETVDASGVSSSWTSFNAGSMAFGIDTVAPTVATVYDGSNAGSDSSLNNGSLSSLSCNWNAFTDATSGVASYDYSIGTTVGGTDVVGWTNVSSSTTNITASSLTLKTNQIYFCNVRAYDNAGNVSAVASSSGQDVAPTLTFTASTNSVVLADLSPTNGYSNTQTMTLTTSTNAYHGYVISAYETGVLTSGSNSIANYAAPATAPTVWTGTGFGYNVSGGASAAVFSGGKYAHFGSSGSPDTPISHSGLITGTAISNEQETVTFEATGNNATRPGRYATTIVWTCVASY